MSEIKPCPFCGKAPIQTRAGSIRCNTFRCALEEVLLPLDAWNRRPSPPQVEQEAAGFIYAPTLLDGNEVTEEDVVLGADSCPLGEDWVPFYTIPPRAIPIERVMALIREWRKTSGVISGTASGAGVEACAASLQRLADEYGKP